MALSDAEVARYARQLLLPGLGEASQEALRAARVRVTGGGLATAPAVYYLAAAGVGTIWIDDPEAVAAALM
jgi:adenylyltransferase/sulfurtransferase